MSVFIIEDEVIDPEKVARDLILDLSDESLWQGTRYIADIFFDDGMLLIIISDDFEKIVSKARDLPYTREITEKGELSNGE